RKELAPILEALRGAKRPFIYAGGGVVHSGASAALREFAERAGVPVGLTLHGLGTIPSDHYLCLHMLGMHGTVYSNYAINDADWLRQIDEWRASDRMKAPDRPDAILPQAAIQRLHDLIRDRGLLDDTIVSTGVGQHQMWAAQFFRFNKPRHWVTSGGLGTMGF